MPEREVTDSLCRVEEASRAQLRVVVTCLPANRGQFACVMAAFTHFTPDVFAPHLIEFQRDILRQYAAIPLADCCKDEWGFLPDHTGCPERNDYWLSRAMAAEYARQANGRDLAADMLQSALLAGWPASIGRGDRGVPPSTSCWRATIPRPRDSAPRTRSGSNPSTASGGR